MTWNAIVAILMMAAIIYLIFKDVCNPGIVFAGVALIGGLLMGCSPRMLNFSVWSGTDQIGGIIFLMLFAVAYFGILHDAGVFKVLVNFIIKRMKNSIFSVFLITYVLAVGTQLDGSGSTTALCTIPPMRPIYDKMKIRKEALMLFFTLGGGTMLLLPWAPGINEYIGYVGGDATVAFNMAKPMILVNIAIAFIMMFIYARIEKAQGAGMSDEEFALMKEEADRSTKAAGYNKGIMIFDTLFTLAIVVLMLTGKAGANLCFGIGLFVMLMVNYRTADERYAYLDRQARPLAGMAMTMFGLAFFLGVTSDTGCFDDLISVFLGNSSPSMLIHIPLIVCIFSSVLQIFVGSPSAAILVPAVCSLTTPLGVDPIGFMTAFFCCQVFSINLCLFAATPFLALNLADVKVKDQVKYSTLPCLLAGVIQAFACVAIGLIPL